MHEPYTYRNDQLREIAFPLGGIGTGCVSLEGRGALRDWEIYNRPAKGTILNYTFATLWCQAEGGRAQTRVVQGPPNRDFIGRTGSGIDRAQGDGLPHFAAVTFQGRFPFANITFHQDGMPLAVSLRAFSPFIPLDHEASAMPLASLTYTLRNTTDKTVHATLAFNMTNPVGKGETFSTENPEKAHNTVRHGQACRGIAFGSDSFHDKHARFGTAALTTSWPRFFAVPYWQRGQTWFDSLSDFWRRFSRDGRLDEEPLYAEPGPAVVATLGLQATIPPGESVDLPILISWCFPNNLRYWDNPGGSRHPNATWTNAYAKRYPTAWDAAEDFYANRRELIQRSEAFQQALFDSTLPTEVIESVANTASILHSPTCLQLEDGTFWAWEGCNQSAGCCAGSCTHVWNYALTLAFLFPALHRSMRRSEYEHGFQDGEAGEKGAIGFRIPAPLSDTPLNWHAASDGQLGGIVQLYRDWRLCGDDDYLKHMWPHAKRALEFAWHQWDTDKDGLVDGDQHNTYDINFQGPNPLAQCFYLAALTAGAEMARYLGDDASADEYQRIAAAGREKTRTQLFNGEFLVQTFDCLADNAPKYQHGLGCLSDQVFGQLAAHVAGLGYVLDEDVVKSSLAAVFKHNFRDPLGDHPNPQRIYAVSDEAGLLLCSWPNGGEPRYPFPYSNEVWTGIEYQVASHLIYEGFVDEGLAIVRAVRARHDGIRRNPYNEFECGHHYARALASWGVLLAMSGFRYDAVDKTLTINPRTPGAPGSPQANSMTSIFTTGSAWGTFSYEPGQLTLNVIEGKLTVDRVILPEGEVAVDAAHRTAAPDRPWQIRL